LGKEDKIILRRKILRVLKLALGLLLAHQGAFAQPVPLAKLHVAYPALSVGIMANIIAQERGYYREEGLEPVMVQMRGAISVQAALTGSVDFTTDIGSTIEAVIRGPKLKVLKVGGDRPLFDLIAHPSIRSFADLKGKKVGVSSFGAVSDMVTRTMLRKSGLQPEKDVAILATGAGGLRWTALKAGSIDAAILTTPFNFEAVKQGFVKLGYSGDYVRTLSGGIITTGEGISSKPELALKFVRATLKGHLFYRARRQESISLITKRLNVKDRELASNIYDFHRPTVTPDGTVPSGVIREVIEERMKAGQVARRINLEEVFDFSFVRRANSDLNAAGWRP